MICPKCDGVGVIYSGHWGSIEDPWQADPCDLCGETGQADDSDIEEIGWLVADMAVEA